MHVAFATLGCRLNEAESESWARRFAARGAKIVSAAEAEVVVLNTCAVTQEAVRKSRQLIRRIRRTNPNARLVVSGCYATLHPSEAAAALGADLVIVNRDKDRLVELTAAWLQDAFAPMEDSGALFSRSRQRAFVKVQDGCRHRCTFCIVTRARGAERSRPIAEVVSEIQSLCADGVREAVLTGVHLGGYGSDLGVKLQDLIRAVLEGTDLMRLRLGSLEPWGLDEAFFELWQNPRLMPHLHLPLQSGSDAVLKRMARRGRTRDFRALVALARKHCPRLVLTTDIIVGFPGETEADFQQTLELVEEIGFAHVHIFPYSPRAGTAAAAFPDQIPEAIKRARSQKLHALSAKLRQAVLASQLGRVEAVLWEKFHEEGGEWVFCGYTPHYLRARMRVPKGEDLTNTIRSVRLVGLTPEGDQLVAEPVCTRALTK
ncbi:tRNA (N(6)-L-threonylcarbamoyladenosine(37)-C(2))-methylthiotransferase MtaB [Methylothermus subterraneus]